MVNGQHSWVAVLVLVGVMAVRALSSRNRRQGRRPGNPTGSRGFAPGSSSTSPPPAGDRSGPTGAAGPAFTGTAPGWFTDPFVRHEQRYWSGTAWTEHVQDGGTPSIDPPPPPRGPAA